MKLAVTEFTEDEAHRPMVTQASFVRFEGVDVTRRSRVDRWHRWLGLWVLSCALARPASAEDLRDGEECSGEPGSTNTDSAKGAFRAGQTAFSEGAYGQAVQLWGQAYREDCTAHALLLNVAMAHELLGRPEDAIHALRLFNRRAPDSPYVDANIKRIERLERASAEKARLRARRERPMTARLDARSAAPADVDDAAMPLPLVVAVAGGAVAIAGGALYAEARFAASSAADRCGPSTAVCSDLDVVVDGERARSRAEAAGWLTLGGLTVAAGGLFWHLLTDDPRPDGPQNAKGATTWSPVLGSSGVALHCAGSF